jgi:hypothetical protein
VRLRHECAFVKKRAPLAAAGQEVHKVSVSRTKGESERRRGLRFHVFVASSVPGTQRATLGISQLAMHLVARTALNRASNIRRERQRFSSRMPMQA